MQATAAAVQVSSGTHLAWEAVHCVLFVVGCGSSWQLRSSRSSMLRHCE
jgi:hypothetical protein